MLSADADAAAWPRSLVLPEEEKWWRQSKVAHWILWLIDWHLDSIHIRSKYHHSAFVTIHQFGIFS